MRKKILLATIAFLFGTLLAWAGGTPSLPLNYQARIINGKFYVVRMLASPDPAPQGTFINSRGLRVDGAGTLYAISPAMAASPTIINSILGVAVDANGYLIVSVSGGSSMTWPSGGAGIPNYNGSSAWGTSYSASNPIPFNFLDTTVAKTDLSNLANSATLPLANGGTAIDMSGTGGTVNTSGTQLVHQNASHTVSVSALVTQDMPTAQVTRTGAVTDVGPVTADDGLILVIDPPTAIHLTRFSCGVQGTTSVIANFVKATVALLADQTCTAGDANTVNTTTWANGSAQCGATTSCAISAHAPVTLHIGTISGTPTALQVSFDYTVD